MEAPKIPSFFGFRTKRPNQFYFEPRYYDERKEKMEQRYERISKELKSSSDDSLNPETFKSTLRENWGNGYSRKKTGNQINKRVLLYVVVLLGLVYYIFMT